MTQELESVFPQPNFGELERVLLGISLNDKPVPLAERFRALFSLKALKTDQAVDIVAKGRLTTLN